MAMIGAFVTLAFWTIPKLNLDPWGTLIGWLVVLAACAQFSTVAAMAPRVTDEQALKGPVVLAQIIGLIIFIGVIFVATRLEGILPEQLTLILMLGVNGMAAVTLAGVLLTPKQTEETNHAESAE